MPPKSSKPHPPTEGERLLARLQEIAPGVEWESPGHDGRAEAYTARIGDTVIKATWNRLSIRRPGHYEDRQARDDAYAVRLLRAIAVARGQDEVTIAYVIDARTGARKALYEVTT